MMFLILGHESHEQTRIQSWPALAVALADAGVLEFRAHFSGQEIQQHFKICHDRPKRITERRRFITLNKTMAQP